MVSVIAEVGSVSRSRSCLNPQVVLQGKKKKKEQGGKQLWQFFPLTSELHINCG